MLKDFKSNSVEYETPDSIFVPLRDEFDLKVDLAASEKNHKLEKYYSKGNDAFQYDWNENSWLNPPFNKDMKKWMIKAHDDALKFGNTIVILIPVRSNTKWWNYVCKDAEIMFITGEVSFNHEKRGLWLPMCILIIGNRAKMGTFSFIQFSKEGNDFLF